jgi:predicted RecB family nuclease
MKKKAISKSINLILIISYILNYSSTPSYSSADSLRPLSTAPFLKILKAASSGKPAVEPKSKYTKKSEKTAASPIRAFRRIIKRFGKDEFTAEEYRTQRGRNPRREYKLFSLTKAREELARFIDCGVLKIDDTSRPYKYRLVKRLRKTTNAELDLYIPKDLSSLTNQMAWDIIAQFANHPKHAKKRSGQPPWQAENVEKQAKAQHAVKATISLNQETLLDLLSGVIFTDSAAKQEFFHLLTITNQMSVDLDERKSAFLKIKDMLDSRKVIRSTRELGRIDLHMHSIYSDGNKSPMFLVLLNYMVGMSVISITDHNNFKSWPEAIWAAKAIGMPFLPGAEADTYKSRSNPLRFHALLYYVYQDNIDEAINWFNAPPDEKREALERIFNDLVKRTDSVRKIHNKKNPELAVYPRHIREYFGNRPLVKRHDLALLIYLVHGPEGTGRLPKSVKDQWDVHRKIISSKKIHLRSLKNREWFYTSDLMAFKAHAPFAVGIAHPLIRIGWNEDELSELLTEFATLPNGQQGFDVVETYHPSHTGKQRKTAEAVRNDMNIINYNGLLAASMGSDTHGLFDRPYSLVDPTFSKSGYRAFHAGPENAHWFPNDIKARYFADLLIAWAKSDLEEKRIFPIFPVWGSIEKLGYKHNNHRITVCRQVVEALLESLSKQETNVYEVWSILRIISRDDAIFEDEEDFSFVAETMDAIENQLHKKTLTDEISRNRFNELMEDVLLTIISDTSLDSERGFTLNALSELYKQRADMPVFSKGEDNHALLLEALLRLQQKGFIRSVPNQTGQSYYFLVPADAQRQAKKIVSAVDMANAAERPLQLLFVHPNPKDKEKKAKEKLSKADSAFLLGKRFTSKEIRMALKQWYSSLPKDRPAGITIMPNFESEKRGCFTLETWDLKRATQAVEYFLANGWHTLASVGVHLSSGTGPVASLIKPTEPAKAAQDRTAIKTKTYISPSDIYTLFQCPHWLWRKVYMPDTAGEPGLFTEMLWENGILHEKEVAQTIMKEMHLLDLSQGDLAERADKTIQAMKDGANLIYQGVLIDHERRLKGIPDLLLRLDEKMPDGKWKYIPIDIKSGRGYDKVNVIEGQEVASVEKRQKRYYACQLCLYADMLMAAGFLDKPQGRIIDIDAGRVDDSRVNELSVNYSYEDLFIKAVPIKYDMGIYWGPRSTLTYWQLYEKASDLARRIKDGQLQPDEINVSDPALSSKCNLCVFRDACKKWCIENNDPTLLFYLGRSMRDTFRTIKVNTVDDLARLDIESALQRKKDEKEAGREYLPGVGEKRLHTFHGRALIRKHNRAALSRLIRLSERPIEVHYDIESDPLPLTQIIFLHGVYLRDFRKDNTTKRRPRDRYLPFLAKTASEKEEKKVFKDFWDWLREKPRDELTLYHFSPYERWNNENLAEKYPDVISKQEVQGYFNGFVSKDSFKELPVSADDVIQQLQEGGYVVEVPSTLDTSKKEYAVQSKFRNLGDTKKLKIVYDETVKQQIWDILNESRFAVDLYLDVVLPFTDWPVKSYGLKSLVQLLGFEWKVPDPGGAQSIAYFHEMLTTDNLERKKELLQWQKDYNESDNRATAVLLDAVRYMLKGEKSALARLKRGLGKNLNMKLLEEAVVLNPGQSAEDITPIPLQAMLFSDQRKQTLNFDSAA